MHHTFLKDNVHMNISKKYTESFEELIGDINDVLKNEYGITLCYDKNDEHMDHSTKPNEDCFSGFAFLYDKQEKESIYPRTIQAILDVKDYLKISEVDGWVDLKKQLDELHQKVSDEKEDFDNE